jgi:hypothetical protein
LDDDDDDDCIPYLGWELRSQPAQKMKSLIACRWFVVVLCVVGREGGGGKVRLNPEDEL